MARLIDPYTLRLFVSVAREGSIARAAEAEHIAASALSRRIAELERQLRTPLVVRSAHGVALTEAGRVVLDRSARIEGELAALAREVQAKSGQVAGTLRVSANLSAIVGHLPELLRSFRAEFTAVDIALRESSSQDVLRACLDDDADVGIGVRLEAPPSIESWFFRYDPFVVILPRGHPAAQRRALGLAEVLAHPLIAIQSGGSLSTILHTKSAAAGLTLDIPVAVNSFDAACRMVEAGLGLTILPQSALSAYAGSGRFEQRTLAEDWSHRELRIYAPKKTPRLPSVDAFLAALRAEASNSAMAAAVS